MASYLPPIKILFGLVMQTPHHPPPPPHKHLLQPREHSLPLFACVLITAAEFGAREVCKRPQPIPA